MTNAWQINKYLIVYFLFFLVSYPVIFFFRITHAENITNVLIPLFVLIIFLFVLISTNTDKRHHILLCFVFLFVFIGDCVINWSTRKELSIIPFGLTHLFLGLYYLLDARFQNKDLLFLIPPLVFGALLFLMVHKDIEGAVALTAFIIYIAILDFMLWRALCYLRTGHNNSKITLVIAGSLFFYVTDIFVSLYAIYDHKMFIPLIWVIYPPALFFLSLINIQDSKFLSR